MTNPHPRRGVAATACVLVLALLLSGCSGSDDTQRTSSSGRSGVIAQAPVADQETLSTSPAAQAIRKRGVLLNGTEVGMPLLSQRNPATGQVTGFDATITKMLAKYIIGEPNVKQVTATGATRESLLRVGTVDLVVHAYTITKKRAKKVSFAGPYLASGAAIATLSGSSSIDSPEGLAGKTVCAIENSSHIAAIEEQAPTAEIITAKTAPQCVQKLESGEADAYVHDMTVLAGAAALNKKLDVSNETFTKELYGIGVPKDEQGLRKLINDWLVKIEKQGLWKKAWERSFSTVLNTTPDPPEVGSKSFQ